MKNAYIRTIFFIFIFTMLIAPTQSSVGTPTSAANSSEYNVEYLIITCEEYSSELQLLANWKTQKGLRTVIEKVEEIEDSYSGTNLPTKIRECIKSYYENYNTQWVLLGGDIDVVPTSYVIMDEGFSYDGNYVACDSYYGDLDYDWNTMWALDQNIWVIEPEVYVGRLSAVNALQISQLVDNILKYEKNPPIGDWMTSALFAGAQLYFKEDWNDNGSVDFIGNDYNRVNNFLNDSLPEGWTSILMAETEGVQPTEYPYDLALNSTGLINEIKQGYSIGTICGHGNPENMVRTIFETDYDGDGLFDKIGSVDGTEIDARAEPAPKMVTSIDDITVSNGKLGMYYLGGCSTGTLGVFEPWGYEPLTLSELFLRNAAIGCIAGDNVVWGEDEWVEREHGGWFSEGLTTRFWEQLFIDNRPGKALALAKMDLVEDRKDASYYEENPYVRWEEKILKQFNLLGDPEVSIWMDRPEHLNFTLSQTDESSLIEVTLNGTQIENATVTLSYDNELHWMGYTNSSGQVEIPVSQEIMNQNHLSVSKRGEIPIQQMTDYIPPKDKIPIDFSLICSSFIIGVVLLAISVRPKKKTKAFTENLNYRTPR